MLNELKAMLNPILHPLKGPWWSELRRRWNDDERGTSTITTAVTLPLLLVVLFGTFHLFRVMTLKWALDRGVRDAAQYLGEESSFWEARLQGGKPLTVGQDPAKVEGIPPADFYDIEAKRIILSRVLNVVNIVDQKPIYDILTKTLHITVTEPVLSYFYDRTAVGATEPITQGATLDSICSRSTRGYTQKFQDNHEWRAWENIRFRVYATLDMPMAWVPFIPYTKTYTVTMRFKNRAVGYVECARWSGEREKAGDEGSGADKTYMYGREGPSLNFRTLATPYFPTVTPAPTETPKPTPTITPGGPTITPTP